MRKTTVTLPVWMRLLWPSIFVVLSFVLFRLRTLQSTFIPAGQDTYFFLNNAHLINQGVQGSAYDTTLFGLLNMFPEVVVFKIFPLVLGLLTMFFFSLLIKPYVRSRKEYLVIMGVLVLSPPFLILTQTLTPYLLVSCLVLFSVYLFLRIINYEKENERSLAVRAVLRLPVYILLGATFLYNPFIGLLGFLALIFHDVVNNKVFLGGVAAGFFFVVLLVIKQLPIMMLTWTSQFTSIHFNQIFSFFGGVYAFTLFLFVLGFGGIFITNRIKLATSKIIMTLVLLLSLFHEPTRILAIFIMVFYSAVAFTELQRVKWNTDMLKQFTIILFICIFAFSTLTFVRDYMQTDPLPEDVRVGEQLSRFSTDLGDQDYNILVPPEKADSLQYFSELQTIASYNNPRRLPIVTTLYKMQDYSSVIDTLRVHNVAYVVFENNEEEWNHPVEGLLLVAQYNDAFEKLSDSNGHTIYYFTRWNETNT